MDAVGYFASPIAYFMAIDFQRNERENYFQSIRLLILQSMR